MSERTHAACTGGKQNARKTLIAATSSVVVVAVAVCENTRVFFITNSLAYTNTYSLMLLLTLTWLFSWSEKLLRHRCCCCCCLWCLCVSERLIESLIVSGAHMRACVRVCLYARASGYCMLTLASSGESEVPSSLYGGCGGGFGGGGGGCVCLPLSQSLRQKRQGQQRGRRLTSVFAGERFVAVTGSGG